MEENIGTLVRLPIRYLHRGLTLTSPMFSWDGERMLLPSNSILTDERIARLVKHNNGRDFIMAGTDDYTKIVGQRFGDAFKQTDLVKERVGYQGWDMATSKVLDTVSNAKRIDKKDIEEIATDLCNKLALSDAKTIVTIINSLNHVDRYLESHCINVGLLNGLIGQWFGLPKKAIDRLVLIGFLHDCGKTRIEKEVLTAPRKLTPEEFLLVQRHPVESYNLLGDYPLDIRKAVKAHHEKLDGTGYPDNLLADQISIEAKITAVADIYDALTAERVYKPSRSPFSALRMLDKMVGTELDGRIVRLLQANLPNELIGRFVTLSSKEIATIAGINEEDAEHPLVKLDEQVIPTSKELFIERLH